MTELHIFNWYVTKGKMLCGDVCVRPYRHEEYIKEKLNGTNHDAIRKKDKGCLERSFVFVQEPIAKYESVRGNVHTRHGVYSLVNMDSYFIPQQDVIMARLKMFS